jgi:hypothetical protein
MSILKAIEPAFRGELATIKVGRHGFDVRPVFGPQSKVQRNGTKVRVENYFRHRIKGKDDRVHYLIEAEKGGPYRAQLVKIEYRGLGSSKAVEVGVSVAGALDGRAESIFKGVKAGLGAVQRLLTGNWEPSALQVIDALGARLASEQ